MTWKVYLSGEIHSDWRQQLLDGASASNLPITFTSAVTDHKASDGAGDLLGAEQDAFWRDHKSSKVNAGSISHGVQMKTILTRQMAALIILVASSISVVFSSETDITVWKSPTCGCCQAWVEYLVDNGFVVTAHNVESVVPFKQELGLTNPALYSCHTALIDGYVVEGHVPASDIKRLLTERPDIVGITAPGMPQMSPGMNSIEPKGYDVLQFNTNQQVSIYSRY